MGSNLRVTTPQGLGGPWGGLEHGLAGCQSCLRATGFWWLLRDTHPSQGDLNLDYDEGYTPRSLPQPVFQK